MMFLLSKPPAAAVLALLKNENLKGTVVDLFDSRNIDLQQPITVMAKRTRIPNHSVHIAHVF